MGLAGQPKCVGVCTQGLFCESALLQSCSSKSDADSRNDPSNTPRNLFAAKVLPYPSVTYACRLQEQTSSGFAVVVCTWKNNCAPLMVIFRRTILDIFH